MEHVYASIDFGSSFIKLAVCELYNNHLNLLAGISVPSSGIKKGLIVNPDLAKKSIAKAFDKAYDMLGIKVSKVIANVPCHLASYKIIKSEVNVTGELITGEDIMNCYKKGVKQFMMLDKELVTVLPIDFKINDKTVMKDPKGFPGSKLSARAMMVMVPKKNVYSVAQIIESLGVEIVDIGISSIGDMYCFKNESISKGISVSLNIGDEITVISLYNKGIPVASRVISIGGKDISSDLSYMYRISEDVSLDIKKRFALASKRNASSSECYDVLNIQGENVTLKQTEVCEIVSSRLSEMFSLIKNEINLLTNKPIQYTIVTGGTSNMLDFEYCLRENMPNATKGVIKLIGARDNQYSTVIGNIIYFLNSLKLKGLDYSMFSEDDMDKLSSPNRQFLDASDGTMLSKVYNYFFGE